MVHEYGVRTDQVGDVIAFDTGDLQTGQAEFAGDVDDQQGGRAGIGDTHVGNDCRPVGVTMPQHAAHAGAQLRVIAACRVQHAVAMAERHGALADALEHQVVQRTALREIDRRAQPVGGEPSAATHPYRFSAAHDAFFPP